MKITSVSKPSYVPFGGVGVTAQRPRVIKYGVIKGYIDGKNTYQPIVSDELISMPFRNKQDAMEYALDRAKAIVSSLMRVGIRAKAEPLNKGE